MKRNLGLASVLVTAGGIFGLPMQDANSPLTIPAANAQSSAESHINWSVLDQYCSDCHNFEDQAGGVAFDIMPQDELSADAAVWEQALRKIRTGLMPPRGKPRPEPAVLDGFATQLSSQLDSQLSLKPNP